MRVIGRMRSVVTALMPIAAFFACFVPFYVVVNFGSLSGYPWLVAAFITLMAGIVGAFVAAFASIASIEFLVRGYQIRRKAYHWAYEERTSDGSIQRLPFIRKALTRDEYWRSPCEIYLPSEDDWNEQVPSWARNRRSEIVDRIIRAFGFEKMTEQHRIPACSEGAPHARIVTGSLGTQRERRDDVSIVADETQP